MGVKVTNNGFGTLSAGINSSATTVTVDSGQGARFPALSSGDFFFATLVDTSNNLEIIKVTARSTDSMTVTRAQDNTTARAFSIGDRIELRPTAALFNEVITPSELTISGDLTVDTNTLKVDSSNNRVGMGTASPSRQVMISRSIADGSGELGIVSSDSSTSGALGNIHFGNSTDTSLASIRATADGATDSAKLEFNTEKTGAAIETTMRIDSNGFVLKPFTPGFSCAVGTGHGATGNLTATAVNWGNIYQNFGNHLSGTTFTVPVTGRYFVTFGGIAGQNSTGSAGRMQMQVAGNVVSIQARGEEGISYSQMAASYIIQLSQNDACTVKIHDRGMWTGGQNQAGTNDPHWSMYLLG